MRNAPLLVVLVVLLAGCAGDDSATTSGVTPTAGDASSSAEPALNFTGGIPAPRWNVGDWWQYQVEFTSGDRFDAKLVVYAKEGGNYLVTSDNRDLVLRATFNHYPNIGPVVASSLNQFIHGVEVSYLKFPMKNGTWQAQYRDAQAQYQAQYAVLDAGAEKVPGFAATLRNQADGRVRMSYGWSPVTKWFTNVTWDFDGNAPVDVTYRLMAWGTNYTGTLPVVQLIEAAHRAFPAYAVPPPTGGTPASPQGSTAPMKVGAAGSAAILGIFAGAGGPGSFEYGLTPQGASGSPEKYEWRPAAAGSYFRWHKTENIAMGDWQVFGSGRAQNSAFLFLEAYEARTTQRTL